MTQIPVKNIAEHWNPLDNPPWECDSISCDEITLYILKDRLMPEPFAD